MRKFEEEKTTLFNCSSKTKAVPLKMLQKELFSPTDQDNKVITKTLEELAVKVSTTMIAQVLGISKGTCQFMSESGGEYSYGCSSEVLWTALLLLGIVAVNNVAESSLVYA